MSDLPWVRFFPSDWLAGTRGMSAAETGIYITLVATMYERGEAVPEDHPRLARLCGAPVAMFRKTLETLIEEGKILRVDAGLWNKRVGEESEHRVEKSEAGRKAGLASGRSRQRKKDKENQTQVPTDVQSTLNENRTSQKPDTRYQIKAAAQLSVPRDLLDRLLEAAGIRGNPNPSLVHPGPIIALIQAGYDLETEILPTMRSKPKPELRSWNFYVPIIREAADGNRQIASQAKYDPLEALRSWPDSKWQVVLDHSRQRREWLLTYGPAPGQANCLVPAHLLKDSDRDMARVAA